MRSVFVGLISIAWVAVAASCGPHRSGSDDDDAPTVDADVAAVTVTVTGRVWAPHQAPGQAAPGQEIPIAGALVYLSPTRPEPIPDHVYCERCVATPQQAVLSGADGGFSLSAAPGTVWLIIQKGQFRIEQQLALGAGALQLPASQTTLPSQWKPEAGLFMPKVALARGTDDNIEDILGKLGFGTMVGDRFANPTGENGPELDLYGYIGMGAGSVRYLLSNIDQMRKYHIIFFPCATSMDLIGLLLRNQTILTNIRRYVNEGGKLYVTDWSGELADRAFPPQIELGDGGADSVGTYDPVTLAGTLSTVGNADGGSYDLSDGEAVDTDLAAWLGLQTGPTQAGGVGMYDPARFEVTGLYNWIKKLTPVMLGTDDDGLPIYDAPKTWVTGSKDGTVAHGPIAVTYAPTGCGKVLYTAFQTANDVHAGLYPQERVLLYLIMEIQTCSDGPIL